MIKLCVLHARKTCQIHPTYIQNLRERSLRQRLSVVALDSRDHTTPHHTTPHHTKPNHTTPHNIRPNQTTPLQTRPRQIRLHHTKQYQTRPAQIIHTRSSNNQLDFSINLSEHFVCSGERNLHKWHYFNSVCMIFKIA